MDNNNLPVELGEPVTTPLLTVYRFRVYKVQKQHFFEQTVNNRCKKFRVYGDKKEFCEVRIYFDDNKCIESVRTYHYTGIDGEMIDYVVKAIVKWLSYRIRKSSKVKYKIIELWKKG